MNKKITIILASIIAALFSIVTFSEAQTMTNQSLNARQEKIVTIPTGCPNSVALPSSRPDSDRDSGHRPDTTVGWPD